MSNSKLSNVRLTPTRKRVLDILDNAPQLINGVSPNMDPVIHGNDKALKKLCTKIEWKDLPNVTNFLTFQQHSITHYQRDEEVRWLLGRCDAYRCDAVVFPLATSYFDRYLCSRPAEYFELRIISSACLFLAAKLRMAKPPKYELLQTDFPYLTTHKLFDYEVKVSTVLKWNFCLSTPYEFYDHFLAFSPFFAMVKNDFYRAVRDILCDFELAYYDPQIQALAALYYSISGDSGFCTYLPNWFDYFQKFEYSFDSLREIYNRLFFKQSPPPVTFLEFSHTSQSYFSSSYYNDGYQLFDSNSWGPAFYGHPAKTSHVLF